MSEQTVPLLGFPNEDLISDAYTVIYTCGIEGKRCLLFKVAAQPGFYLIPSDEKNHLLRLPSLSSRIHP